MSISLSNEDLKREQERQRKRGRLIFKTLKKGKVKVYRRDLEMTQDRTSHTNIRYMMLILDQ